MQRTHFTAGFSHFTLYNCVRVTKKKYFYTFFFTKPISNYGTMLKYQEKNIGKPIYRSISTIYILGVGID